MVLKENINKIIRKGKEKAMPDQQNNVEENKDRIRISGDGFNSAPIQNYPTKIKFTSILLSVAFYLSIIYLVLFISYFALSGNAWGLFILIFLGPNLLSIAIFFFNNTPK